MRTSTSKQLVQDTLRVTRKEFKQKKTSGNRHALEKHNSQKYAQVQANNWQKTH